MFYSSRNSLYNRFCSYKGGKICSVKIFDKSDGEGDEASKREFKNLKTLKHEKIVSFISYSGAKNKSDKAHFMK